MGKDATDPPLAVPDRPSRWGRIVRWVKGRVWRGRAVPDNWFDDIEPDELAG